MPDERSLTGALIACLWALGLAQAIADPQEVPTASLLTFLGQFEDAEGEWIDPLTIGELPTVDADEEMNDGEPREDTDDDDALDDQSPRASADDDGIR